MHADYLIGHKQHEHCDFVSAFQLPGIPLTFVALYTLLLTFYKTFVIVSPVSPINRGNPSPGVMKSTQSLVEQQVSITTYTRCP